MVILILLGSSNFENNSNATERTLQQGDPDRIVLQDTRMINRDKGGENIYHNISQLSGDPLVLVPLSILRSCLKMNNSYVSPHENNEKSNVHENINLKSGTQHNLSRSNALDRPEKGPSTFKSSINIRTGVEATPTLKGEMAKWEKTLKRNPPEIPQKLVCEVCGDKASNHLHYGGRSCHSCRAFFRRTVEATYRYIKTDRIYMDVFLT